MYSYEWDSTTGGLLLNSSPLSFSKEPRPVYYKELDILGFDRYWNYEKNDSYPYMWAETNTYWYRGRKVAQTKGGSLYTAPEIIILEEPEMNGAPLRFVDIPEMVEKNKTIMEGLVQETIKKVYNNYIFYKNKVDVFYVAFSGGKDSIVVLDIVQRALPHNDFKVVFGDTGMEFSDTYEVVEKISKFCKEKDISFLKAGSNLSTGTTWKSFGPPAVTNRWCCSVHKTSPQIRLLQQITGTHGFTGMAFTGIRGDESTSRNEYEDISFGEKHQGQFSCHPLLEWNSAELYTYIYQNELTLNEAYKKGNSRAGCLICPMSSGKHEYMKMQCYPEGVSHLTNKIIETSGKTSFTKKELVQFVDDGNWKTRKSGRELNFGQDKHIVETTGGKTKIIVFNVNSRWKEWAKTLGTFIEVSPIKYTIDFQNKIYTVQLDETQQGTEFTFPDCGNSKSDLRFISLFRSVIVKSIYCINCGVCIAECTNGCIDMSKGLHISNDCKHCFQCHDIQEHCLRYNSIRNRIGGEKAMKGLDRYFSFGVKAIWLNTFYKYKGTAEFWDTDGDSMVGNKKKDSFLNFVKDAGLVVLNKSIGHDKYTKHELSPFGKVLITMEPESEIVWALLLCNLAYTAEFNWYVKNIPFEQNMTLDQLKLQLESIMENDVKGLGKRNITDALKIFFVKTPFGTDIGLGIPEYEEKTNASGNETITLKSFRRTSWQNPEPRVILYSLYKFAEACGDYYQFTLGRLLNHDIDSDGVSPTEVFGIDRDRMEKMLTGLSINYPEFINASFTLDLDNITLRSEKTSQDVLNLFQGGNETLC